MLKLVLPDDTVVFKVGMTNSNRATDRMMEVVRSWFNSYRFVPYTSLRLDREVENPLELEQAVHKVLAEYNWIPDKKVDGGTEMFTGLDELRLVHFVKNINIAPKGITEEGYAALGRLLRGSNE